MSASKERIVGGVIGYVKDEILPMMHDDRALQIGLSVALNAIKANDALIDRVFDNAMVKALLTEDEDGLYDIDPLLDAIRKSMEQYGELPITLPAIPLIAPHGATVTLKDSDIEHIRRRIEGDDDERL